eukprot:SAG11_NODE_1525_length_4744_cov_1.906351_1_plen_91_part_00
MVNAALVGDTFLYRLSLILVVPVDLSNSKFSIYATAVDTCVTAVPRYPGTIEILVYANRRPTLFKSCLYRTSIFFIIILFIFILYIYVYI